MRDVSWHPYENEIVSTSVSTLSCYFSQYSINLLETTNKLLISLLPLCYDGGIWSDLSKSGFQLNVVKPKPKQ